jgi:DNA repair photolyase
MRIARTQWGGFIDVKRNIPKVLAKELKTKKRGVVGISTTTDPYQPQERKYKLTRYCLEQLLRHDFPVSILTKSPLVTRDLDLFTNFKEIEVGLTVTTNSDDDRRTLEPGAPTIESRIGALEEISREGVTTYAFLGPLYPTNTEEDLRILVGKIKDAGVGRISSDKLNLRPGIWRSISEALKDEPEKERIWKQSIYGKDEDYNGIFHNLEKLCKKEGIIFEFQRY